MNSINNSLGLSSISSTSVTPEERKQLLKDGKGETKENVDKAKLKQVEALVKHGNDKSAGELVKQIGQAHGKPTPSSATESSDSLPFTTTSSHFLSPFGDEGSTY